MKTSFLIICILIPTIGLSQESVGFQNKADFQKLIDYRLPEWGYKNFFLSTSSARFNWRDQNLRNEVVDPLFPNSDSELTFTSSDFNAAVNPRFVIYRESEQRIYIINTSLSVFTQATNSERQQEFPIGEDIESIKLRNIGIQPNAFVNLKEYINSNFFISASMSGNFQITRSKRNEEENSFNEQDVIINRNINTQPSFGIGFGRIRNITPILRSLRVNERYKALGGNTFSDSELMEVAELFTKYQGYQQRYDRPLKYFWEDINEASNNKLDQLSAYELFYLNDVFDENLGQRFEGSELMITGFYRYINVLRRTENVDRILTSRDITLAREAGFQVTARVYKNLSLEHQLSTDITTNTVFPLERVDPVNWEFNGTGSIRWLWNIADQLTINTSNSTYYQTFDIKENPELEATYFTNSTQSGLTYFIENKMSISAGVSLNYIKRFLVTQSPALLETTYKSYSFGFNFAVRYYFDRNLY